MICAELMVQNNEKKTTNEAFSLKRTVLLIDPDDLGEKLFSHPLIHEIVVGKFASLTS